MITRKRYDSLEGTRRAARRRSSSRGSEPRDDLRGVGSMRQQKRHDAARCITEKRVLVRAFGKQRFRERERLGVEAELVGRRPERRAAIGGFRIASPRSGSKNCG